MRNAILWSAESYPRASSHLFAIRRSRWPFYLFEKERPCRSRPQNKWRPKLKVKQLLSFWEMIIIIVGRSVEICLIGRWLIAPKRWNRWILWRASLRFQSEPWSQATSENLRSHMSGDLRPVSRLSNPVVQSPNQYSRPFLLFRWNIEIKQTDDE